MSAERWIQEARIKKGALHRQLGYTVDQKIPLGVLQTIKERGVGAHVRTPAGTLTITNKMKKRANFALNIRGPY